MGAPVHSVEPDRDARDGSERRFLIAGWVAILLGAAGFAGWAAWAPLDRGVAVQGTVIADGHRKPVQHLSGGRVQAVLVREGDTVTEGQAVVQIDTTRVQAEFNAAQATVLGLRQQIQATREARSARQLQARLLAAQIAELRPLAEDGIVPRNRLVDLERQAAQLDSALAQDEGALAQAVQQIAEIEQRQAARRHEIDSAVVRAGAAGTVQSLSVFGPDTVAGAGQVLMEIVPANAPLRVEAQVPVHLIDRLQPGLQVDLMFTALNLNETPIVPGEVLVITPDRVVDERTGQPYYRVQTSVGASSVAGARLRHGMPVDVFVKTGERSLASYLLKPLTDRMRAGMRED